MQEERFKVWLGDVRGFNERTVGSRLSNCKRVEANEGDLDKQWDTDELAGLIDRLTYSREDERSGRWPKHRIQIHGDVYDGTATLRNAVMLYHAFRSQDNGTDGSRRPPANQQPQVRRARRPGGDWPVWPQPNDEDFLEVARTIAMVVRFLDPGIVYAVAEDNRRMGAYWSARLEELGIDPLIYLWEGSPCAFPGVRRSAGSTEIAVFRQRATADGVPPQCLSLDDNDYPKHLWAFVFTGKPFRKRGPDGYQLAHLFDHKEHGNRWGRELDHLPGTEGTLLPYGLFTSAANSVYVPDAFLRPTDFSTRLRNLIQRRALQLYGNICCVLPRPLAVKRCEDPKWALDNFRWSAAVGGMDNVPDFLEFRRGRMEELFDKRYAALQTDRHGQSRTGR